MTIEPTTSSGPKVVKFEGIPTRWFWRLALALFPLCAVIQSAGAPVALLDAVAIGMLCGLPAVREPYPYQRTLARAARDEVCLLILALLLAGQTRLIEWLVSNA